MIKYHYTYVASKIKQPISFHVNFFAVKTRKTMLIITSNNPISYPFSKLFFLKKQTVCLRDTDMALMLAKTWILFAPFTFCYKMFLYISSFLGMK